MVKMRIPIREQLGALILLSSLVGLAVLAIATWVTNHSFVQGVTSTRLSLTASLKAAQLASNLVKQQTSVRSVATRVLIQSVLLQYYNNNATDAKWARAADDLLRAVDSLLPSVGLYQAILVPRDASGPFGSKPVLNATATDLQGVIPLPYKNANGSVVFLGDNAAGFPPALYPNLTYHSTSINSTLTYYTAEYDGHQLNETSTLLLGPYYANETTPLLSYTVPVRNNTSANDILGWLTIIADASSLSDVVASPEGLDTTGVTLLLGPTTANNHFSPEFHQSVREGHPPDDVDVHFVLYPQNNDTRRNRHNSHASPTSNSPFNYSQYPAVKTALTQENNNINHAGSMLSTLNEDHYSIAVGYAIPPTPFSDWLVLVEQSHQEVWAPIVRLRKIILACVFGTIGGMLLFAIPAAHYSSRPIRRLGIAAKQSVSPPGYSATDTGDGADDGPNDGDVESHQARIASKEGFRGRINRWRNGPALTEEEKKVNARRRTFRIPPKVKVDKHFIRDELTDLTITFNEMSDELFMQYERLEERVRLRTEELEISKKAAEAANESKTLFIANISHELKTPLNGILGMCAVCMQEDDPMKLKRSLGIIYKSGDLLLNLLTDLLTFSKNQVGQHLTLDEKNFRLRDVSSQILVIFENQAKEKNIELRVIFEGTSDAANNESMEPLDRATGWTPYGKVSQMALWGDQHRILQVVINLVSNSLKFTPHGGHVAATIRCLGEVEDILPSSRKQSLQSRTSKASKASKQAMRLRKGRAVVSSNGSAFVPQAAAISKEGAGDRFSPSYTSLAYDNNTTPPQGVNLMFEFEVQDSGPGIPESQQQRIFEPFVQGDLGLSKKYGGTGLGLSICSQLASLLGGTIHVTSKLEVGSTFVMQIPLRHVLHATESTAGSSVANLDSRRNSVVGEGPQAHNAAMDDAASSKSDRSHHDASKPAENENFETSNNPRLVGLSQPFFTSAPPMAPKKKAIKQAEAQATSRGDKVKVLVAEDNKVNQEVVLRMLKLEDVYDVTVAKDGQEALDKVKESMANDKPYNLIFMDVQMPNLDGLQSTRLIRQTGYSAPIVALTAFAEESNVQECYKSGMDFFLAKPIRRPALKNVLNRYCAPILEVEEETIADPKPTAAEVASTVQAMADPGTTTIIVSTAPITNTTNPPTPTPTPNAAEEAAGRADQHGDSMRKDLSPHS